MADWRRLRNAEVEGLSEGGPEASAADARGDEAADGAGRDRLAAPAKKPAPAAIPTVGPGARRLLDLIARAEGTSGDIRARKGYASDYDVTFGYGAAEPPGRRKPLTQMSLDEGRELQRTMRGSSAIGRYQFMPGTLKGLRARHGLSGAELMDDALQDGLARSLLKEKGYDAYGRGGASADKVLDGLARIWASLPDGTGRSKWTYGGRPQPVGTTRAELRAALDEACRVDFGAPAKPGR